MKKAAYLLLPFICMVLSCSKDEGGFAKDEFGRISQTAYLPAGMPDNVAVFHNEWNPAAEDQYYTGVQAPVPASMQQDGSYSFSYPALPSVQAYNYYFLSPYKTTLTRSIHKGNSAVKARVFSVQYPSAEGIDRNYDYRIGTNAENVKSDDRLSCSGFKGIVSNLLIKVSDPGNVLEGKPLNVATITFESVAEGALAGMFLTGHSPRIEDCGIIGIDENACGNGITLLYPEGLQPQAGEYPLHYATLPCSIAAGTKAIMSLSTPLKTVSFAVTLSSALDLHSSAQLVVEVDSAVEGFAQVKTQVQFFNALETNTIPLSQETSADSTYRWGFSSCARYTDEYGLPTALKMVQNSSITFPQPEGYIIKSLRVYAHEDSYNSPLNDTYLILKNMGKPQQTISCGHYNSSIYDGGYVEFTGLDAKMSKMTMAVEFSDEGLYHILPVGAILFEMEKGTYIEDTSGEIDYYESYMNGDEITIGDITISLAKNGEAKLIKPEKLSYTDISNGGIYILDDAEGVTVTPDYGTATTKAAAAKDNLIIMGRYGNSALQTGLKLCELRMNSPYAVTFFNVRLSYVAANNTKSQYAFARNSSDANHSTLRFVDCMMDYRDLVGTSTGYYLVFASNGANGYFENVIIDNCVVRMTSEKGKIPVIYYNNKSRTAGTFVDEKLTLRNTVICTEAPMNGYVIWSGNDRSVSTPFLSVDMQNCTVAGFHNEKGIFRAGELKSLNVENNVFHAETSASTFLWVVYSGTAKEGMFVLDGNRLYNSGDVLKWNLFFKDNYVVPAESGNEMAVGVPFLSGYDRSAAYVPVDPAVVGAGVGASYDTKKYIVKPSVQ